MALRLGCFGKFFARPFADSLDRTQQHFLAEIAHLTQYLFELAVVGNGLLIKLSLLLGKSYCVGLGSDLASPAPGIGWVMGEASLADPGQSKQLFFGLFVASSDPPHCGGRVSMVPHAVIPLFLYE